MGGEKEKMPGGACYVAATPPGACSCTHARAESGAHNVCRPVRLLSDAGNSVPPPPYIAPFKFLPDKARAGYLPLGGRCRTTGGWAATEMEVFNLHLGTRAHVGLKVRAFARQPTTK